MLILIVTFVNDRKEGVREGDRQERGMGGGDGGSAC